MILFENMPPQKYNWRLKKVEGIREGIEGNTGEN